MEIYSFRENEDNGAVSFFNILARRLYLHKHIILILETNSLNHNLSTSREKVKKVLFRWDIRNLSKIWEFQVCDVRIMHNIVEIIFNHVQHDFGILGKVLVKFEKNLKFFFSKNFEVKI